MSGPDESRDGAPPPVGARGSGVRAVEWRGDALVILDQTALPAEERWIEARDVEAVAGAIGSLAVRGAPLLGIAAAFGLALAARRSEASDADRLLEDLRRAGDVLVASRPTAVNISWAVERLLAAARAVADEGAAAVRLAVEDCAQAVAREDEAACRAIGELGAQIVPHGAHVLTHCNTGALATGGIGTALGVIVAAHERGLGVHVWVDETRPVLQGARLTAWELGRLGIPMTLIADVAAASLMASGSVDLVVVGADRIAMNGDVANKVGTYALAVLARHHGVPFYVAAPVSTVDPATATGGDIVIERRDPAEVTSPLGATFAPEGTPALNPAFDVTPADLVTAIVTERGFARAPYRESLARLLEATAQTPGGAPTAPTPARDGRAG